MAKPYSTLQLSAARGTLDPCLRRTCRLEAIASGKKGRVRIYLSIVSKWCMYEYKLLTRNSLPINSIQIDHNANSKFIPSNRSRQDIKTAIPSHNPNATSRDIYKFQLFCSEFILLLMTVMLALCCPDMLPET